MFLKNQLDWISDSVLFFWLRLNVLTLFFQILEVNGQSFEHGTRYARALEILKGVCHLSVTVKSNLLAFQEMLQVTYFNYLLQEFLVS